MYLACKEHSQDYGLRCSLSTRKKDEVGLYGGKVALLRCTKNYQAKRKSKNHRKGEVYIKDSTINSVMYRYQMTRNFFPKIKKSDSILDKSERFAEQLKPKIKNINYQTVADGRIST